MMDIWMNKWYLLVVSENSKLCVTKNKGKETIVFQENGRLCEPPKEFCVYLHLWRHIFHK